MHSINALPLCLMHGTHVACKPEASQSLLPWILCTLLPNPLLVSSGVCSEGEAPCSLTMRLFCIRYTAADRVCVCTAYIDETEKVKLSS